MRYNNNLQAAAPDCTIIVAYSFIVTCACIASALSIVCIWLQTNNIVHDNEYIDLLYSEVITSNNFRITRLRDYFSPPNCLQLQVRNHTVDR